MDSTHHTYCSYISVVICTVGLLINGIFLPVLANKRLREKSIYLFLIIIAISDSLWMCLHLLYTINYEADNTGWQRSFYWNVLYLTYAHATFVLYLASTWLHVALAIFRCLVVKCNGIFHDVITRTAKWALVVMLAAILVCSLNFATFGIVHYQYLNESEVFYRAGATQLARDNQIILKIVFLLNAIVGKFVPCLILTGCVACLIYCTTQRNGSYMSIRRGGQAASAQSSQSDHCRKIAVVRRTTITTNCGLICVLSIYLICQLPQGVLNTLEALRFCQEIDLLSRDYYLFAKVSEQLSLLGSITSFSVLCLLCREFRIVIAERIRIVFHCERQ